MINLPRIQSIIAPLAAPAAPAVLLSNEIYRTMIDVDIPPIIAILSAIVAIVGVEFSGALMCHNAVKAWQRRSPQLMYVAIIGALVYAVIVIAAVATMPEARGRIFGVMVLLTLVAYAGYAIYTSFEAEDTATTEAAQIAITRLDKERLLTNAKTRQVKAGGAVQLSNRTQSNTIEQTGQPAQRVTPSGQRVIDYLAVNGDGASLREIARECGIKSPSTVKTWLEYWRIHSRQA